MKLQGCVYSAKNKVNSKEYIGQHGNVLTVWKRWNGHLEAADGGSRYPFHAALRKYTRDGFVWSVLWHGAVELLNEKEIYYIKKRHTFTHDPTGGGYNQTKGGNGARAYRHSTRTKKVISNASLAAWKKPGAHERASAAQLRSYTENPERGKRQRAAIKSAWQDEGLRKRHSKILKAAFAAPEVRAQRSAQRRAEWARSEHRVKMLKVRKAQDHTMCTMWLQKATNARREAFRSLMSDVNKANWIRRRSKEN